MKSLHDINALSCIYSAIAYSGLIFNFFLFVLIVGVIVCNVLMNGDE